MDEYRNKIDQIDNELKYLLDERFSLSCKVGEYKKNNNIKVLNQERESYILKNVVSQTTNKSQVLDVYKLILELSKELQ
jgi:chorismate mutase